MTAVAGGDLTQRITVDVKGEILELKNTINTMDGYETAQIVRNRDQTKGIPIVFLSAVNKEAEHLLRGYAMGAVDYVFKPVDPVVLRSKVAVFVDLFAKTKEIERKARQEQALLDATLRANTERLRAEQELRLAEQRQSAIIQSLPMVLYLDPYGSSPRRPTYVSGDFKGITGFELNEIAEDSTLWSDRLHPDDRERVLAAMGRASPSRDVLSKGSPRAIGRECDDWRRETHRSRARRPQERMTAPQSTPQEMSERKATHRMKQRTRPRSSPPCVAHADRRLKGGPGLSPRQDTHWHWS